MGREIPETVPGEEHRQKARSAAGKFLPGVGKTPRAGINKKAASGSIQLVEQEPLKATPQQAIAVLRRQLGETLKPEEQLIFGVISQAMFDIAGTCKADRNDAINFLTDGRCELFCDFIELNHEFVAEVAGKLARKKPKTWPKK